ncbi:hypothetical protein C1646_760486 [Rhizophagus diaphanus]|nr:hypothetical protein C1646_760486 [Rhizophagus diaphanus] [Rhizophagus sp. MUCL 43196]
MAGTCYMKWWYPLYEMAVPIMKNIIVDNYKKISIVGIMAVPDVLYSGGTLIHGIAGTRYMERWVLVIKNDP